MLVTLAKVRERFGRHACPAGTALSRAEGSDNRRWLPALALRTRLSRAEIGYIGGMDRSDRTIVLVRLRMADREPKTGRLTGETTSESCTTTNGLTVENTSFDDDAEGTPE